MKGEIAHQKSFYYIYNYFKSVCGKGLLFRPCRERVGELFYMSSLKVHRPSVCPDGQVRPFVCLSVSPDG